MRIAHLVCSATACLAVATACSNSADSPTATTVTLGNPDSLSYLLLPSSSDLPAGVLLSWQPASDPNVTSYVIYSAEVGGSWNPIAYTGETAYFDPGSPANEYYVASQDANGDISSGTPPLTVSTAQVLPAPDGVTATVIDSGVELVWSADARLSNQAEFSYYRVYSEPAVIAGSTDNCPAGASGFGLEGSTVSEGYVVTGLANGSPRCFGVTTVAVQGQESALGAWVIATPSPSGGSFNVATAQGITVRRRRSRR